MTLDDIKKYFEENKDKEEVKAFVAGLNPVTLDRVQALAANDKDLISWLDSEKDKHLNKGLESWKSNNLESLLDAEVKKRFPDKDPKDVELEKIKAELAKMQTEKARESLTNKAIKLINEKKLPLELVDYVIATDNDEEKTIANLTKLEEIFNSKISEVVEQKIKGGAYVPPADNPKKTDYESMSMEDYAKQWQNQNK